VRAVAAALLALLLAGAAPTAPEPTTLPGGQVLDTEAVRALWARHAAAFIDVLPAPPRPAGLPPGTLWQNRPRRDIPGSLWLANTGYPALAPGLATYFAAGLAGASHGARDAVLVFYCRAHCRQSWNAAERAIALGYTHVAWYPGGTDAWAAAGLPLEPRMPAPVPAEAGDPETGH
jgi:PQQ-dependent catabolism-associated CXXCW motif protein